MSASRRELLQMMESVVSQDGTRQTRCARRLSRRRQNRHGVDGRRGRILIGPVQGVVRRRRARESSAAGCDRRDRRAGRRQLLRRRRRRAGVRQRHGGRAAPARRAAGWSRPRCRRRRSCRRVASHESGGAIRTKHDATTLRQHTSEGSASAARGSDVAVPPDVGITDLTLDSRSVQFGRRIHRAAGNAYARHRLRSSSGERRRESRSCGSRRRVSPRRACRDSVAAARRAESHARCSARSPIASSMRRRRPCASVGVTGTNGKTTTAYVIAAALQQLGTRCRVRGHARLSAASMHCRPATHTTPDCHHRASSARRTARRRRALSRRWKCRRTRSISIASTACASIPRCSRISRAIISTITARSRAYGAAKAQAVRVAAAAACGHQCRRCVRPRAAAQLHARLQTVTAYSAVAFAHRAIRACVTCSRRARSPAPTGLRHQRRRQLGRRDAALALHRRLQRRESARGARRAARLGRVARTMRSRRSSTAAPPPGRMETLAAAGKPLAIVDYAHTPDALEKALRAVRKHCDGQADLRLRLRRRSRSGQAPAHGRDRRATRRSRHRHRRQPAHRRWRCHRRRHRQGHAPRRSAC